MTEDEMALATVATWVPCKHDYVDNLEDYPGYEFLNIEEGMFGEDNYTYICPFCKEKHKGCDMVGY